jgi:hypothetical protein
MRQRIARAVNCKRWLLVIFLLSVASYKKIPVVPPQGRRFCNSRLQQGDFSFCMSQSSDQVRKEHAMTQTAQHTPTRLQKLGKYVVDIIFDIIERHSCVVAMVRSGSGVDQTDSSIFVFSQILKAQPRLFPRRTSLFESFRKDFSLSRFFYYFTP